jgi:hypothetical protein
MTHVSSSNIAAHSSVLSSGIATSGGLTADGMMIYLQTRLGGIDSQIEAAFQKQKQIESLRGKLMDLQNSVTALGSDPQKELSSEERQTIAASMITTLDELTEIDPLMADKMRLDLQKGGVFKTDGSHLKDWNTITEDNVNLMKEVVGNRLKALESSASLEMIQLQQLMSARQTAIQLATNLVSSLGKGEEAIAANIGR